MQTTNKEETTVIDNQYAAGRITYSERKEAGILVPPKIQSPANRLADAVDRIDAIADQLRHILDESRGAGSCGGVMAQEVPKPPVCLFWALRDAPDTIHKKVDECQNLIQEVRTLLFGEG